MLASAQYDKMIDLDGEKGRREKKTLEACHLNSFANLFEVKVPLYASPLWDQLLLSLEERFFPNHIIN